ncbi:MAG: tetratricopeptide repeat protein [Deltaproteobacteria bacterium]|nr:tetratricopeptide repeat protein [Deltaproteobacteria bacterium]
MTLAVFLITIICWVPEILPALTLEEGVISPELKKALHLTDTGHPAEALRSLSGKKTDPSTATYYHFVYGRVLEKMNKTGEALEHYRSAYFHAPSEELKALAFLERAEAYFRIHNYYEAKTVFNLFLKKYGQSNQVTRAHLGLAQSLARIGNFSEALLYFEKAGEGPVALLGKADVLHRLGRFEEAHLQYLKGIAGDKHYFLNSPEHLFYYGENLFQMGNDQDALQYLTSNMADPSFKKKANLVLGRLALKTRKFEEASKLFSSALTAPDTLTRQEALFYLAETQASAGHKTQARQGYQEYWAKYPAGKDYEEALIKLGKLDLEEGRLEQSDRWIKELSCRSALKEKTLKELEWFLLKLKEKAPLRMVSLWNFIGPKLLNISREPFLLLMTAALKGQVKPYLELQQWLAKNGSEPVKIQSSVALVQYQVDTGNLGGAKERIRTLRTLKVAGDEILRLEARISHAQMDYATACERLLSLKKMEAGDLSLFQDTLLSARNVKAALGVFEKNLLRLGGNSSAYIKLADIYHEKGKKKEALHYYQKALENDPLNEWALYRAGHLMTGEEGRNLLSRIKSENSLLGKIAKAGLKEIEIQKKSGEAL